VLFALYGSRHNNCNAKKDNEKRAKTAHIMVPRGRNSVPRTTSSQVAPADST
jgi:hypothetical protein